MSYKILIIDDDIKLLKALQRNLNFEENDFEIIIAQDSYQGLAIATNHKLDIIILDVNMPAGGGFSVHKRLLSMEKSAVPVIYITGEDTPRIDNITKNLGAAAVIQKPFETKTLIDAITAALTEPQKA